MKSVWETQTLERTQSKRDKKKHKIGKNGRKKEKERL